MPLQSTESIHGFRNLSPGFEATLMTFTRPSEYLSWELVLYWLSTPSTAFLSQRKAGSWSLEVFVVSSMPTEVDNSHGLLLVFRVLPWLPQPQKSD
jgi:hypothetical protein